MNAEAWYLLAYRSRTLVHQASMLMGALTQPAQAGDATPELSAFAAQASSGVEALLEALATAPELAAHRRTIQRFDIALGAWRRSVDDASPLAPRYQAALLQQAAQVLTSCLHVEALCTSESARVLATRTDLSGRTSPPPP
jgi:hypothetical protein